MKLSFQKEYEAKLNAQIDSTIDQMHSKNIDALTQQYYKGVLLGLRVAKSLFCLMMKERGQKMMKRGIRVKCYKCGVTARRQDPLMFAVDGWCISDNKAFCPECSKKHAISYDCDKFEKYFEGVKTNDECRENQKSE